VRLFPPPVGINTRVLCPEITLLIISSCPSRKLVRPKVSLRILSIFEVMEESKIILVIFQFSGFLNSPVSSRGLPPGVCGTGAIRLGGLGFEHDLDTSEIQETLKPIFIVDDIDLRK